MSSKSKAREAAPVQPTTLEAELVSSGRGEGDPGSVPPCPVPICLPSALADVVGSRVCSDGGSIPDISPQYGQYSQDVVRRTSQCGRGLMRGEREQFVTQFDGLPFRQASERKQCGAKRAPEVP